VAYSNWGGYAYKNGIRVVERSDCVITPKEMISSPGMWPGFAFVMRGDSVEQVQKKLEYPSGHVVVGDGPIYIALYKASYVSIFNNQEEIDLAQLLLDNQYSVRCFKHNDKIEYRVETEDFIKNEEPCNLKFHDYEIMIYWLGGRRYCQYIQLKQPDATVWHGWSGFEVGAGFEEEHLKETENCEYRLKQFWPETFKK